MGKVGLTLVTGGLGFIGLHLADELVSKGNDVILLDCLSPQVHGDVPIIISEVFHSSRCRVVRGDIRDRRLLEILLPHVRQVVHLASETGTAQSMYEIERYCSVNLQGTATLLDSLVNFSGSRVEKVILASSRSIYGEGAYSCGACGGVVPSPRDVTQLERKQWEPNCPICDGKVHPIATAETSRPNPASIYAATKLAQEDLVRISCFSKGIPNVVFRFQNVYGQGQSLKNPYTGILSVFSTRVRRGLPLPIFEDGKETRDFVHVSDVVSAISSGLASSDADGETLNVGSGIGSSVLEVGSLLNKLLQGKSKIRVTGEFRVGDIRHCFASLEKIRKLLGWIPKVSLEEGLAQFVDWVRNQPLPEDALDQANQELKTRKLMG